MTLDYILIPLLFWIIGYFATQQSGRKLEHIFRGSHPRQFIKVPLWFYLLCGFPKGKGLPRRVLTLGGLAHDLITFIFLLLTLTIDYLKISNTEGFILIVLMVSYAGGAILSNIIYKLWPYQLD